MELTAAALLFLSLITMAILGSFLGRQSTPSSKGSRRPPGPLCLPFIGSLLHMITSQPHVALRDLAKKHGPVMRLRLGQANFVVLSSPAAAQEVFRDANLAFASRPSTVGSEILCYGNLDVAFAPYGAYWRAMRKLCAAELLSARKVRQFAPIRDGETMAVVAKVRSGEPVNVSRLIMSCSNAITGKATFGQAGGELLLQFQLALENALRSSAGLCVGDLFPSLRFVDTVTGLRGRLLRDHRRIDAVIDKIIAECEARRREGTGDDDLLTTMLRIRDEGGLEVPIGTTSIKAIIFDLFGAGAETTSAAAEWVMSEMIRKPAVMAKAQAEVRRTLDDKSPQDHEGHLDKLLYMKMVIKESMRLNPVLPFLLPRVCGESCDVGGYEVAEGSTVLVNVWAMARSPGNDAEEFRPERFEDDSDGSPRFESFPFGGGKRMCPGNTFGMVVLELLVARLIYYFDWSLPAGMRPDELDMDATVGGTARRKNELYLVASPYKSSVGI